MEPSNLLLVSKVVTVLRERIAPALSDDAWAASELRSVCSVLSLVAARMEHEDAFLASDNAALQRLLRDLTSSGLSVPTVDHEGREPVALNTMLRSALEDLLPVLHDGCHPEQLDAVRTYLNEAAQGEKIIYGPLCAVAMF